MIDYPSVNPLVAVVISKKLATLHELETIYSLDDLFDMCEIIAVNNYNEALVYES